MPVTRLPLGLPPVFRMRAKSPGSIAYSMASEYPRLTFSLVPRPRFEPQLLPLPLLRPEPELKLALLPKPKGDVDECPELEEEPLFSLAPAVIPIFVLCDVPLL